VPVDEVVDKQLDNPLILVLAWGSHAAMRGAFVS
jgi:hypothetical protein